MIHPYQLGGYNIVLDSCSGGVHVVDEVAYAIITEYESKSREEILDGLKEGDEVYLYRPFQPQSK